MSSGQSLEQQLAALQSLQQGNAEGDLSATVMMRNPQNGKIINAPKYMAAELATQGFEQTTPEQQAAVDYANNKLTAIGRVSANLAEGSSLFTVVDRVGSFLSGQDTEEQNLRRQAAALQSSDFERGAFKALGFGADLLGGNAVSSAAKIAQTSVAGQALLAGGSGAVQAADMYLTDPNVRGEVLGMTVVGSALMGALSGKLAQTGASKLSAHLSQQATANAANSAATHERIANQILQKMGMSAKKIEKMTDKGTLNKFVDDMIANDLVQDNHTGAIAALQAMRAKYKPVMNGIEDAIQKSGATMDMTPVMARATAQFNNVAKTLTGPTKKTFLRQVGKIVEDFGLVDPKTGVINNMRTFKEIRSLKRHLQDEINYEALSRNSSSAVQDAKKAIREMFDDIEDKMISDHDPSGAMLKEWNVAKGQSKLDSELKRSINKMLYDEAKTESKNRWGDTNLLLAGLFALDGNMAGIIFNGVQQGANFMHRRANSASYLMREYGAPARSSIKRQMIMGAYNHIAENAWQLAPKISRGLAEKAGERMGDTEKATEGSVTIERRDISVNKKKSMIRQEIVPIIKAMREELATPGSQERYLELATSSMMDDPDEGMAMQASMTRIMQAVDKHLPRPVSKAILDDENEEDNLELSDMDAEKAYEAAFAIMHPTETLQDPTPYQMRVLSDAYPEVTNYFRQELANAIVQGKLDGVKFMLEDKTKISDLLGADLSNETSADFVARLQAFSAQRRQNMGQPPQQRSPAAKTFDKAANNAQYQMGKLP